ncbi:hypothetical protein BACCIP111899_01585 [Bacillus rhizoplanae]|uniref:Uncharacterized protein n=1 Tax=Bacillus rhizoplanae TaxID=2880966 RepID=A0ABM8Y9N9_9BACI|nr:hypothetical protein [Bacillus rhizoplanae]CAG9612409.1 hypothetical protein BACCIP111899_01585 [Bacillus rhizoplanae]
MAKITVVDSIMGSGKTSWALQHINESRTDKKYIYITPYLDEVQRVINSSVSRKFIEPNNNNSEGRKLRSLKELIIAGHDICATHSLFQSADDELLELLTGAGYTLILDEVMNVIDRAPIDKGDIELLTNQGYVEVRDNRVYWTKEDYNGRFEDIKLYARSGNLFLHRKTFILWAFPPKIFSAFDDVYVLTYLFDAQIQRYYYDLHEMGYTYKSITKSDGRYELAEYSRENERREEVMKLIDLYAGQLNDFADRRNALSTSWLDKAPEATINLIKRNVYNYFRNYCKSKTKDVLWTTIKKKEAKLRGKGYTKGFIPVNTRATNDYADRWALAYVYNRYMNPFERAFFEDNGVSVNEELLAVSDLLQWVWRSRIRNGQSIKLYLPSSRMRGLLKAWEKYEI